MAVAAVLSGLGLVDLTATGHRGAPFLAVGVPTKFRTLGCLFSTGERSHFITDNYSKNQDGSPIKTKADILELMGTIKQSGAQIYVSVDTYLTLVYAWQVLKPEDVYRVFPFAADSHCQHIPEVTYEQNILLRRVAHYYWHLSQKPLVRWDGIQTTFAHRAAHTVSYRSNAHYHTVKREIRGKIRPIDPTRKVLHFDWSAAEWSLILQICGYEVPDDAYEMFTKSGLDRDLTKKTILAWVYGAAAETLAAGAGSAEMAYAIIAMVKKVYPKVAEWVALCRQNRHLEFMGWKLDLGEAQHARPNHYAQTALQLCKWDLIDRLLNVDGHLLACGDLHDQLFFDFNPISDRDRMANVIAEINKPAFGCYRLTANIRIGDNWTEE